MALLALLVRVGCEVVAMVQIGTRLASRTTVERWGHVGWMTVMALVMGKVERVSG